MHIDAIFAQLSDPADRYEVMIDNSWSQGRTSYGGLTAGLSYLAMHNALRSNRPLRAFHCNFIGPADLTKPITVSARVLRNGGSVSQVLVEISQFNNTLVLSQGCFGESRPSKLHLAYTPQHSMPAPKKPKFIPQIPKLVPKFLQHFELSLDKGALALAGAKDPILNGWCRFKHAPSQFSMAHLITLMDCWPPTMLQMLRLPAMASTMSWDIEFIQPKFQLKDQDWLACQCRASHIQDGYGHEEALYWDASGRLIAVAKQVVTIFA